MAAERSRPASTMLRERYAWFLGIAITLIGFLGLYGVVRLASVEMAIEPWLIVWLEMAVLGVIGALLLIWALPCREAFKFTVAIGVVSLFLTFIVMASLKNTPYNLEALSGDQGFYSTYVTKFAVYDSYVDVVYADLPAFYPPLFYYGLGRIAAFLAIDPYKMIKISVLITTLLLPFLLALTWRQLVGLPMATAAAFSLLVEQQWYKPAEWITMTLFIPWWLYWVENVTQRSFASRRNQWLWWITGGLVGGLLFQTYYYWFFVGGISLVLQVVIATVRRSNWPSAGKLLANALPVLVCSAIFSAPYWAPYLYSMMRSGGWQVLQNRWLASYGWLKLHLPVAGSELSDLALFGGLLYLGATAGTNRISRSLLTFLIATYSWLALGYVGILADMPVLTFRAYPLVDYIVALGLAFGIMRLWRAEISVKTLSMVPTIVSAVPYRRIAATGLLILILVYAQTTIEVWLKNEDVVEAATKHYPQTELAALDAAVQGDYLNRTFLLSLDYVDWIAYRPFYAFLAWSAHYSHPAAHFYDRLDLLEKLTTVQTPALFAAALMNNRYAQIDHLALGRVDDWWTFIFFDDNFPNRNLQRTLAFAPSNLSAPYFDGVPAGEQEILTPNQQENPLPALLEVDMNTAPLEQVALAYALVTGFGRHLAVANSTEVAAATGGRLQAAALTTLALPLLVDLYQFAGEPLRTQIYDALITKLSQPTAQLLTDQIGVEKMRVIGYIVEPTTAEQPTIAEQPTTVVIYLEVLDRLDWDYTVWFHAFGNDQKQNLDFTPLQATSTWQPGQIVRLTRTLPLAAGDYELQFGFWRSAEDVRLVAPSGEFGLSLGRVIVP